MNIEKAVEIGKKRINQIEPFLPVTGEYNDEYKALQIFIDLAKKYQKMGDLDIKKTICNFRFGENYKKVYCESCWYNDACNQVAAICKMAVFRMKPSVDKVYNILCNFRKLNLDDDKNRWSLAGELTKL